MVKKLKMAKISDLLYDKVHSFVLKKLNLDNTNRDVRILENKLIFIIHSLSLSLYGTPIFYAKFYAKDKGPVEADVIKLQNQNKKEDKICSNKAIYLNEYFAKFVSNKLFQLTTEAIDNGLLPLDVDYLVELTHTDDWKSKFESDKKYKESQSDDLKYCNKYSDEDMYEFANTELKTKHSDFFNYIKEGMLK